MLVLALMVTAGFMNAADAMAAGHAAYDAMALEVALKDFESAAKANPDDVDARIWVGVVLSEMGRFKEAKAAFVDALKKGATAVPDGVPPRTRGLFESAKLEVEPPHPLPPDPPGSRGPPGSPERAPDVSVREAPHSERSDDGPPAIKNAPARVPWVLVGGGVVAAGAVVLAGTGALIDVAVGPKMLDGGIASNALYASGSALFVAGGALAVVGLVTGE